MYGQPYRLWKLGARPHRRGAGLLPSLSMTGSGHLAMRTPPSDQLVGVHMTFNLHGADVEALDNSGLHGMQYLVRASRGLFQSLASR